jgi:hypothetical protein
MREVIKGAFEIGVTLGTLIAEMIAHPDQALQNLLQAAEDIGQTLTDVFNAAIIETAEQFLDQVVEALVEIGKAALDILVAAVLEIAGGAIGTVIAISSKPCRRRAARSTRTSGQTPWRYSANTIDLDAVHISVESGERHHLRRPDFFNQLFSVISPVD